MHIKSTLLILTVSSLTLFGQTHIDQRLEFNLESSHYSSSEVNLPPTSQATIFVEKSSQVKAHVTEEENGSRRIHFQFPEPVSFHHNIQDNTLYLEVNQTIDSPDLLSVQEKVGSIIKRFANGYNTLYLVADRPVHYLIDSQQETLTIDIILDETAPLKANRAAKVAFARLLMENRAYWATMQALQDLQEEYPDNIDVLLLAADLEGLLPRWQNQVEILHDLHVNYPLDEDIRSLMYVAMTPHSSYVKAERQMQRTITLAAVQVYLLESEVIARKTPQSILYAGAQYQLWDGHVSAIVNSQGNAVGFRGWRNRGALFLRQEWRDGSFIKGTLYDQKAAFGMGLEYGQLFPFFQGSIRTDFQWHRPTWEIFECLAFNGREDRFYSIMDSVINRYIFWNLGGGARRVGISGTPNGFVSAIANASFSINLVIPNPIFGINYSLDAEYVLSRRSKIGSDGIRFFPVPYTSFENHTLKAYLIYIFRDRWYISAYGGRTFNRLGLTDTTCGVELSYIKPVPCGWEAKISYNRFPSTIVQGTTAEFLTGTLIYRF